jgi:hypothetical protein
MVADQRQEGPTPYTISIPDGENAELRLMCNMNFDLNAEAEDDTKGRSSKTKSPKADSKKCEDDFSTEDEFSTDNGSGSSWMDKISRKRSSKRKTAHEPGHGYKILSYSEVYSLTAKLSGLGRLEGPSTWTLQLLHDEVTDSLVVQATEWGDEGEIVAGKQLVIPLRLVPETHLRLYADLDAIDKKIPGAAREQDQHITGFSDRENGRAIKKQKQTRVPPTAVFKPPVRLPQLRDRRESGEGK